MRLLETLHNAVWAIHPMTAESYLPLVANILRGNVDMNAKKEDNQKPLADYVTKSGKAYWRQSDAGEEDTVAVYGIEGAITKADQWCGPSGTVTLMRTMLKNDKASGVVGHLLEIDSGGGEATNIEEVANFIRMNIKKPVVAHWNGLMCSAAYGIGCAADEVYGTLGTDIVGSVGVLITLADWKGYFEKEGLKIHEIYAAQSSEKNRDFQAALEGDYTPLRENLLNPFAESFIATVQKMRPATTAHADIFTGKTYLAKDAKSKGLIDGLMSYGDAVQRVFQLANKQAPQNSISNSKNSTSMKLFGIDFGAKAEDGSIKFTAEQVLQLEAASQKANDNAAVIEQMQKDIKANTEAIEKANATIAEQGTAIADLKKWQDETPATAAAKPTEGEKPAEALKPWEEFNTTFAIEYINNGITVKQ